MSNLPSILIPDDATLEAANQYVNSGYFGSYTREITADISLNHTAYQMMAVISGLNSSLKSVVGMENVGKEVAMCVKPLLNLTDASMDDDITALFTISPDQINMLKKEGQEALKGMDEEMQQIREKTKKHGEVGLLDTLFYMVLVVVTYKPRDKLYNMFWGYSYERDASLSQLLRSQTQKKLGLLAMEARVLAVIGRELKQKAGDQLNLESARMDNFLELLQ